MNTLREALRSYLDMRHSLGFKMQKASTALVDFLSFLEQHHACCITQSLALEWAQLPANAQPSHWANRLRCVRGFARYRSATDPRTEIPLQRLLPFRAKRARPFLYSEENIRDLLRAALEMKYRSKSYKLKPWVYYCLFGLLSVSGLRLGEACSLTLQDVDLQTEMLTIRGAKFGKDRLVPLHSSSCDVLASYLAKREHDWAGQEVSSFLFLSSSGDRLKKGDIYQTFNRLSRQIGLRGPSDKHGPRIHDFRHRFAVMTLLRWYRSGEDVERRLPFLSAYLGHIHVGDTYWYLSAWPELMQEAMSRLERCWEGHR